MKISELYKLYKAKLKKYTQTNTIHTTSLHSVRLQKCKNTRKRRFSKLK